MAVNQSETYSKDPESLINVVQGLGFDGVNFQRAKADALAQKITIAEDTTYIAYAAPGTSQADPLWQVHKVVSSATEVLITWADGNASFDNVATDLTGLDFS